MPSPRGPSVILLSFNSAATLPGLLRSIELQTLPPVEVLLLDNASEDSSPRILEEWSRGRESVRFEALADNLGFAAAMNRGIDGTRGATVCLLNGDVELDETFLEKASRPFVDDPRVGMVTGAVYRLVDGQRTRTVDSLGVAVSRQRVMHDIGSQMPGESLAEPSHLPFGVSGCCPLYRRAMLEAVQVDGEYFREVFESYYEDVDLAWRARLRGWIAVLESGARAWHVREGSLIGEHRSRARRRAFRNRIWTLLLNERASIWLRHAPFWLPHEIFQLAKIVRHPDLIAAWFQAWRSLPRILRLRRENRGRALLPLAEERALFTRGDGSLLRRIRRRLPGEVRA